jgi:hypothetical protein
MFRFVGRLLRPPLSGNARRANAALKIAAGRTPGRGSKPLQPAAALFAPAKRLAQSLLLGRSDGVGHDGATRAEGLIAGDGRIAGRLVLNFRVQLRPEQNDDRGDPHPHH